MEEVNVSKLTPKVLTRLAKGLPIKIKGGDIKLLVDKNEGKKIMKKFLEGKGITKKFSEKEIEANAKGGSIFGDRFKKFLKRLGIQKAAYKFGDVLKPAVKAGIATALTAGAAAAAPLLAESAPALIPALPAAVVAGSKMAGDFLDKPSDFGVGSGLYAGTGIYARGGGHYDADGTYHPNKALTHKHNFNLHRNLRHALGKGEGLYAQPKVRGRGKKLLDQSFTPNEAIKFFKKDLPKALGKGRKMPPNFTGGALKRNISHDHELASVGIGGTLLSNFEQHPAQRSQPWSQNFRWSNSLPRFYQQFSDGLQ